MNSSMVGGDRLRELFDELTDLPPEQQDAFLERECGDNPRLHQELARLLSAHEAVEQQGRFRPLVARGRPSEEAAPPHLPGYVILEELGRGGMGIVYKARQVSVAGRLVALKIIKAGLQADSDDVSRFRVEIEAIARLHHPNIVQIYEVGDQEGLPFFSLEFCPQGSLDRKLTRAPLPPREAARLVETLARAVHHAHERGVLHRDLKPANVLLCLEGAAAGGPFADRSVSDFVPKIADFGLAKKLDEPGQTTSRAILGTPQYMAPEQVSGGSREVGPATDVYALGALLYECLTGRPPFTDATVMDTLQQVLHNDPVPVRSLQPRVPRDLETVCSKCLHKEPVKRYASAAALAEDLGRFRNSQPIQARTVSAVERCLKWARRRPAVAGLLAAVLLVTAIGAVLVTWGWRVAAQEAANARRVANALILKDEETTRARQEAARNHYFNWVTRAHTAWARAEVGLAMDLLDECPREYRGPEWDYLRRLCSGTPTTLYGHNSAIQSVSLSRDGTRLATGGGDPQNIRKPGEIKIWDPRTGKLLFDLHGHTAWVSSVCFSPDGKHLASASWDQSVKLWEVQTGREVLHRTHQYWVNAVCFSPDGNRLAVATGDLFDRFGRGRVQVGDLRTGAETLHLLLAGYATAVSFSPDGRRLAIATGNPFIPEGDGEVQVWDMETHERARTLRTLGGLAALAFSPDGKQLAGASPAQTSPVWDVETGRTVLTLSGHTSAVLSVCFSPDGTTLATSGRDQTVRLWDGRTGLEACSFKGHVGPVAAVAFDAAGARLISGSWDRTVRLWDASDRQGVRTFQGPSGGATAIRFSPDGDRFATGWEDGSVRIWEVASGREVATFKEHAQPINSLSYSPDGAWLASAAGRVVNVWDVQTQKVRLTIPDRSKLHALDGGSPRGTTVAFSPDGGQLAFAGKDGDVRVCEASSGRQIAALGKHYWVSSLCYSPDGAWLAGGGDDGTVGVWNTRSWERRHTLTGHTSGVTSVCFDPDSSLLASGSEDWAAKLWDVRTGREVGSFRGHRDAVTGVTFSPDGDRVASVGRDKTVKLWELRTGQEILSLTGHRGPVNSLAFSPDGSRLASVGGVGGQPASTGEVKVWDLRSPPGPTILDGQVGAVTALASSPDGLRVASGSEDHTVRVWDVRAPHSPHRFPGHTGTVLAVCFNPDGTRVASAGEDRMVKVWDREGGRLLFSAEHPAPITALSCSPDGTLLASASVDGTLNVWEFRTGTRTLHVPGTQDWDSPQDAPIRKNPAGLDSIWESRAKPIDARRWKAVRPAILDLYRSLRHPFDPQGLRSWHRCTCWVSSLSFSTDGTQVGLLFDHTWRTWDVTTSRELDGAAFQKVEAPGKGRLHAIPFRSGILLVNPLRADQLREELELLWADRPGWHEERLRDAESARDPDAAEFHLIRLLASDPENPGLISRRGRLRAETGRWKQAVADFTRVVERDPDWRNLSLLAWARLGAGQEREFRVTVQDLAMRCRDREADSAVWAELARLALLLPEDLGPPDFLPAGRPKPKWWDSLALLRASRFEQAVMTLRQVERFREAEESLTHLDDLRLELLLALAHLGCGERALARGAYEAATAALDAPHPNDPNRSNFAMLPWDARVEFEALRRRVKGGLAFLPEPGRAAGGRP